MTGPAMQRQRGAVTLVGALFLILSIIVLLAAVQRMAASSITDSALHSDGVEALFIAESGLERAAWRYAGGSACTALAGETGNIGRGSFLIVSANLVGTDCRVRVRGNVTTTVASNAVNRTLEGDLSPPGGSGWAVGKNDGGELMLDWNGSSWTRDGPYGGIPDKDLFSVHCVASNDCWAVGEDNGGELIIHWDGSSWSRVGPYGGIPDKQLNSVHCVASNDCWAVGKDGGGELIIHWDGSSWSRAGPYGGIPNKELYSVHCVASNDCWAVGKRSGFETIIHWDGSTWTRSGNSAGVGNKDLNAVYMVSATEGYAVGKDGTLAVWDGVAWVGQASPSNHDLFAVTAAGGTGAGGVAVVGWSEVIQ